MQLGSTWALTHSRYLESNRVEAQVGGQCKVDGLQGCVLTGDPTVPGLSDTSSGRNKAKHRRLMTPASEVLSVLRGSESICETNTPYSLFMASMVNKSTSTAFVCIGVPLRVRSTYLNHHSSRSLGVGFQLSGPGQSLVALKHMLPHSGLHKTRKGTSQRSIYPTNPPLRARRR